jgi:Zn-dependent protease/CBS domain-containing protein
MFLHRVKLFTLAGFAVWLDASWLIFAALITWTLAAGIFPRLTPGLPVYAYWWMGGAGTVGFFVSIVLHEFSHSVVARRFSIPIAGITLFIFGGVAELHSEPENARSEFFMAVVGPLTSFVLGGVFLALSVPASGVPAVRAVLFYLGAINWFLAAFNLVPAFPLDGGRVFRSVLWAWRHDYHWATNIASGVGSLFGILLIAWGVWQFFTGSVIGGIWSFFIGLFLHGAAGAARQQMQLQEALAGLSVAAFMNREPVSVRSNLRISDLVENYLFRYNFNFFPVVDNGEPVGCISARQIRAIDRGSWNALTVAEVMERCLPENTVAPGAPALDALLKMQRAGRSRLSVVKNGKLCGVLSLTDMLRFLSLRLELGDTHPSSHPAGGSTQVSH